MIFEKDSSNVVILLDAGASFGSEEPAISPLGNQLFDELAIFSPHTWGQIPHSLSSIFKKDFEEGMVKTPPNQYAELYIEMAAYFFAKRITPNSLYIELAKRIKKTPLWRGSFVTLNYECLLEQAFSRQDIKLSLRPVMLEDSFNNDYFEILKPHGACNLYNSSLKGARGIMSIDALGVHTSGEVMEVLTELDFKSNISNNAFPPVMSYFEPNKATTSGVSFIQEHRSRYFEKIVHADKIVIIGVLPRENDRHIWEPLSQTSAQIMCCSGVDGAAKFLDWSARFPKRAEDTVLEKFFQDGFEEICTFSELKS